jgi:hypothetical protein
MTHPDPKTRFDLASKSSILQWFQKVKNSGIPVPKTTILELPVSPKKLQAEVKKIGFPLFMKTDLIAGKHHWVETCFVETEKDIEFNLRNLLDVVECADMEAGTPVKAIVFREYIMLNSKFKAFTGMPVAPERRYFINKGKVICHHPYWIEDAIRFWGDTKEPEDWRELLAGMNTESEDEIELLTGYVAKIAKIFNEDWCVDFAQKKDESWFLVDMQRSPISWHPECPYKK